MQDKSKIERILANIIAVKKGRFDETKIPSEIRANVLKLAGYQKVINGDVDAGLALLEKAERMTREPFINTVLKIGLNKIMGGDVNAGLTIIDKLQALGRSIDYAGIDFESIADVAFQEAMVGDVSLAIRMLQMVNKIGNYDYFPRLAEIGYQKIMSGMLNEGFMILKHVRLYGGKQYLEKIAEIAMNKIKRGDVEFGIKIIAGIKDIGGDKFLDSVANIGYDKIMQGDVDTGMEVLKGVEKLGGKLDSRIAQVVDSIFSEEPHENEEEQE